MFKIKRNPPKTVHFSHRSRHNHTLDIFPVFISDRVRLIDSSYPYLLDQILSHQTSEFRIKHDRQWWTLDVLKRSKSILLRAENMLGTVLNIEKIHEPVELPKQTVKMYIEVSFNKLYIALVSECPIVD